MLDPPQPLSMAYAVHGFTLTVAACTALMPCRSSSLRRRNEPAGACMCVRHVPAPGPRMITQSPLRKGGKSGSGEAEEPALRTSASPSLPGTAEGLVVEREVVNGGWLG